MPIQRQIQYSTPTWLDAQVSSGASVALMLAMTALDRSNSMSRSAVELSEVSTGGGKESRRLGVKSSLRRSGA